MILKGVIIIMIKVKPNIGILNALIRITIGLTVLSWSTAKLVKRPYCNSYLWVSICGAMKVAEGIVRYCPVTAFFQKGQESAQSQEKNDHTESRQTFNETVPANPT
jgi:hypothetical protein